MIPYIYKNFKVMRLLLAIFICLFSSAFAIAQCPGLMLDPEFTGCEGDTIVLDATCSDTSTYQWFLDGGILSGETNPTLLLTIGGLYEVEITTGADSFNTQTTVIFNDLPSITEPTPLEICDNNNDGFALFDLTLKDDEIINGASNLVITYHETLSDAQNAVPSIVSASSYANIVPFQQSVFARASNSITGCASVTELLLSVSLKPSIGFSPNGIVIEDENTGGFTVFDLTQNESILLNGQDPNQFEVFYFLNFNDAFLNVNPILNPDNYINVVPFAQVIYSIVVTADELQCKSAVRNFSILIDCLQVSAPEPISMFDLDGDDIEVFDLTSVEDEILINVPGNDSYSFSYHETELSTYFNGGAIDPASSYANQPALGNPQTIYVRVENLNTGCLAFVTFQIIVLSIAPDSDDDGIPDTEEDVNSNGDLEDDDTDDDGIPNYLDSDDDGDTVPTATEIEGIGAGFAPQDFIDTDDDGIENYLDDDDDGDGALTIEEDYNNNGTPLDDDTNNNDIPDFLDFDVNLGVTDFTFGNVTLVPNPAIHEVMVSWSQSITVAVVNLYSIRGELVQRTGDVLDFSETSISLADLASGVYFVQLVAQDGQISTQKLIKK